MVNNITILEDKPSDVQFIYHMSDIHIKAIINTDLKEHYLDIIEQVCSVVSKTQNSLIVICGDTLDTIYSTDCISMIRYLFHRLANIMPVIYIIGNHEMSSKKDQTQADMISPLVSNYFESKYKIYPLIDEGLYQYNNIIFGLTKMKSVEVYPCKISDKRFIKIALHHGQVSHDKLDSIVKKQCNLNYNQFEQYYDLTLLGDCHSHCYLNSNKTIAYSGSLYEVNYRETDIPKGLIRWNLTNKKSEFIRIEGIIKHVMINVKDGLLVYDKNKMPQKARIKIIYANTTHDELNIEFKQIPYSLYGN